MPELKFYLLCASITWLITEHREAKMFQSWLFYKAYEKRVNENQEYWAVKNSWAWGLYSLITCSYCTGFWVACIVGIVSTDMPQASVIIQNAFISALISVTAINLIRKLV